MRIAGAELNKYCKYMMKLDKSIYNEIFRESAPHRVDDWPSPVVKTSEFLTTLWVLPVYKLIMSSEE